jgi:purine-binding chemotaxis protein CheW
MEPMLEETLEKPGADASPDQQMPSARDAAPAPAQAKAEYRMIAFSLAGRDYGIDIMKVKEISHEGKFTYVPNTAPSVLGVHNLRGEIIPIIDLRRLFNLTVTETREGAEQNVLILQLSKIVLGVVVDTIDGVMGASADSVQPPHPIFDDINIQYISGIVEKEGKLYVILDVERIFQETPQAAKPVVKAVRPLEPSIKKGNQEFRFVCESLATFASFFVTPMNIAWVEKRFAEWRALREKAGINVQLGGADDAQKFLSSFASPNRGELWSDAQRSFFLSLLPHRHTGNFVAWNHGCGRGFDVYSLVCTLKAAFPALMVKALANDGNLVEIASAPTLIIPKEKVPPFYLEGHFMTEAQGGCQFTATLREGIIFEYTDSLERMAAVEADLIIARDILSYQKPESQKTTIEMFSGRLKPGGILCLGANERVEGQGWRSIEKGGLRAFVRDIPKE